MKMTMRRNRRMSSHLHKLVFLLGILFSFQLQAQDDDVQAGVDFTIQQDQEVWMGQQITLNLDLKTTGFSFSNSHFNLPEVDGAFLMQTDTTTIKLSEKVDGQDWQVVRYPLALYPQKPGQMVIPPINVRFSTSAGFGSTEKTFEFQTKLLELAIKLPPGVKAGDLVVTTGSFQLDHNWQPDSGIARTGDALTLTVKRSADDISAMLLPPLPVFQAPGLAAYPQAPEIKDKTNRGDLTGERIDSIIWVIEKPGDYTIPGIRFQWWDPVRQELKQRIIEGINLSIPPSSTDSNVATNIETPVSNSRSFTRVLIIVIIAVLGYALWLRNRRETSDLDQLNEKAAFARLQKACLSNQAGESHSAIYAWLACLPASSERASRPATMGELARMLNDSQLAIELENLQKAVVSPDSNWQGKDLLELLKRIRHTVRTHKIVQSKSHLAPLNP
jgi:hypothetical protein